MKEQIIYSPQMFNSFAQCPLKYYFKYEKCIQAPQLDTNFLTGKNIHALAAYYLKGEDISLFNLSEKEKNMFTTLLDIPFFKLKTERVESNIACKINDFWIGGRIDALVKNESEEYFILDYKTGEIPNNAKYDFQTIIYLLCCDKLLEQYKQLSFVYINVRTGKYEKIMLNDDLKHKYVEKIKNIHEQILKYSKSNQSKVAKCDFCEYSKICV